MARRSDHTRAELRDIIIASACRIIQDSGLNGLSIRKIAKDIGYTSGTLYQHFRSLDELIIETHILTLDALYDQLSQVEIGDTPETSLQMIAQSYLRFSAINKNRWNALFTHTLPLGHALPQRYDDAVLRLFNIGVAALQPIFSDDDSDRALLEARVLWSSLYGIVSLETTSNLSRFENVETFTHTLFQNYVAGLRVRYG